MMLICQEITQWNVMMQQEKYWSLTIACFRFSPIALYVLFKHMEIIFPIKINRKSYISKTRPAQLLSLMKEITSTTATED